MDKDRSKKKGDTLWKEVKRSTAKQFQYWKPKTQGPSGRAEQAGPSTSFVTGSQQKDASTATDDVGTSAGAKSQDHLNQSPTAVVEQGTSTGLDAGKKGPSGRVEQAGPSTSFVTGSQQKDASTNDVGTSAGAKSQNHLNQSPSAVVEKGTSTSLDAGKQGPSAVVEQGTSTSLDAGPSGRVEQAGPSTSFMTGSQQKDATTDDVGTSAGAKSQNHLNQSPSAVVEQGTSTSLDAGPSAVVEQGTSTSLDAGPSGTAEGAGTSTSFMTGSQQKDASTATDDVGASAGAKSQIHLDLRKSCTLKLKIRQRNLDVEQNKKFKEHFLGQTELLLELDLTEQSQGEATSLFQALETSYNLLVKNFGIGCLEITVECVNLEGLERLWNDYQSGELNDLAERCLVTDNLKKKLNLETVQLKTSIAEESYMRCKKALLEKSQTSCMKSFDLNSCRSKLEDHYLKTATVPTSVWSKKSVVDIDQIYTRLSWVKEEQTPTGTTQSELKHYTELFTANKNGVIPKRILVQGQTGIGKSTFVKKLLVDWVGVNKGTGDEQAAVLKNFELVVAVNLKEVSKCQSLRDVITLSNVFAKEDKYITEGLVDYITNNQEKVLLIFDGYDEYRCGRDSEIYEIFSGNNLRSCCVLITSRISKADELRGGEDLHAEIIGFSKVDRKCFMRRFLNSKEVSKLEYHLYERQLQELAKVPLLLLFFCILWRKGQSKSFPKSKTTLYMDIIQFILNHNHSKQTGDKTKTKQYVELKSFKGILSEIGKVALQGLLKDDHLFEYSQLSDSVRCDESVFIGLLQITEYSETSQPVGMVSFIHKSIQEFLAAWYITYRCIPEGGNLGEIGLKLEECMALENVFEFICGLSEEGAFATFSHLKSVRISDPSLDLSKTVPDVESKTDMPLSDVTYRHWQFSNLVLHLFERVESKADLSRPCLDCLGSVLLCSGKSLPKDLLLRTKEGNPLSLVSGKTMGFYANPTDSVLTLNNVVKMLVTESSEIFNVAEFLEKFQNMSYHCRCSFSSVLCFFNGQVYLYITHVELLCEDHARLFTDHVIPSYSLRLSSGQLSLKYLKVLECSGIRFSMERLGAVVKHCNHLELIKVSDSNDSLSHFLQHVPNYRRCSLSIRFCCLSSKGAIELSYLVPRFENIIQLDLRLTECSDEAVTKFVAAIKHKTLENLTLSETNITSAVAEALSQSLPELSALRTLKISSSTECSDEAVTKLVAAINHKTLEELELSKVNLPLAAAEALSQSLPALSALRTLKISSSTECSDNAVTKLVAAIKHKTLEELELSKVNLTSAVAEVLRQSLSELSALKSLSIGGVDGCSLRLQIFGIYTVWPLSALTISGCTECSAEAVARLIDVMKHKPLKKLKLSKIHLTSAAAEALSQSLPELSALQALTICGLAECSSRAVTSLVAAIKHKTLNKLTLSEINPTAAVAETLGQSL